jgi:drug/metabolite transporter (DMT)-like permease
LRGARSGSVNRASSVIYGNLLIFVVTLPWFARAAGELTMKDVLVVLYLGVVQLGLSYTLCTLGMARGVRSLDAGVVGYIEPMLNPVWVFLFLDERPSKWALVGGCIIIAAVLVHTIALARRAKAREP